MLPLHYQAGRLPTPKLVGGKLIEVGSILVGQDLPIPIGTFFRRWLFDGCPLGFESLQPNPVDLCEIRGLRERIDACCCHDVICCPISQTRRFLVLFGPKHRRCSEKTPLRLNLGQARD